MNEGFFCVNVGFACAGDDETLVVEPVGSGMQFERRVNALEVNGLDDAVPVLVNKEPAHARCNVRRILGQDERGGSGNARDEVCFAKSDRGSCVWLKWRDVGLERCEVWLSALQQQMEWR